MDTKKEITAQEIVQNPSLVLGEIDQLLKSVESAQSATEAYVDLNETFEIAFDALKGAKEKCEKLLNKKNKKTIPFISTACNTMLRQIIDQCTLTKKIVSDLSELSESEKKSISANLNTLASSVENFLQKVSHLKSTAKKEKGGTKKVILIQTTSHNTNKGDSNLLLKPGHNSYIGIIEATTVHSGKKSENWKSQIDIQPGGESVINEIKEKVILEGNGAPVDNEEEKTLNL